MMGSEHRWTSSSAHLLPTCKMCGRDPEGPDASRCLGVDAGSAPPADRSRSGFSKQALSFAGATEAGRQGCSLRVTLP